MSGITVNSSPESGLTEADHNTLHTDTLGLKKFTSAVGDPTVNDDNSQGYGVGAEWINTTDNGFFKLKDDTVGAAVWEEVGAGGGGGSTQNPALALYAYLDGDVAAPNSVATTIPFDTELEDGDAAYNNGTGIYIVPADATYEFNVQITHSGNTDIEAIIELDTGGGYVEVARGTTASGIDSSSVIEYTAALEAGDLVRVRADNLTGTNATVRGETYYGTNETFFYVMTYTTSDIQLNGPVVSTEEIDFTSTGTTTLYVPTGGKKLIVQQVVFELTQYNSPNSDGSASFGVSGPGYSDYKSPVTFTNANAVGDIEPFDVFIGFPAVTDFVPVTSANPLVLNISSADTGTALAAKAHVIGVLVDV